MVRGPGVSEEGQTQLSANPRQNGIEVRADVFVGEPNDADAPGASSRRSACQGGAGRSHLPPAWLVRLQPAGGDRTHAANRNHGRLLGDRARNLPPMPAIFPDQPQP